jgi:hypothetical protein
MRGKIFVGFVGALTVACQSDGQAAGGGCADLARHFEDICGEGSGSIEGEALRYDCDTFGTPADERSCFFRVHECDPDALDACGLRYTTWSCSEADRECPPGLTCNATEETCVECRADADCPTDRICLEDWCVRATETNIALRDTLSGL